MFTLAVKATVGSHSEWMHEVLQTATHIEYGSLWGCLKFANLYAQSYWYGELHAPKGSMLPIKQHQ
ncbi:MAG: hypothetical protein FJ161_04570 [Gammaproteobacteria bacterium]|nr:hypothetical protein [Gammaproteobacteria bacterium]